MTAEAAPSRKNLVPDVRAGLTTGIANIPDAMASAILAGANPVQGLYAIMIGTPLGAIFGSFAFMNVSTTSALAITTGMALSDYSGEAHAVAISTLAVLTGLVIAVVLSLIFIVYRASRPYIALLGRAPGSTTAFGDVQRHPEYEQIPGLMMVRMDAPLYFLNAGVAQTVIREMAANLPTPRALLIDVSASGDLDIPTMDLLADVNLKLSEQGVTLMFAQMRGGVHDRLERAHLMEVIGPENTFPTLTAGVDAFLLHSHDHAVRALHDHERMGSEKMTTGIPQEASQ